MLPRAQSGFVPELLPALFAGDPTGRSIRHAEVNGLGMAILYARRGRLISAIKHIEANNPEICRRDAKRIVEATGYGHQLRWPEEDKQPIRCL